MSFIYKFIIPVFFTVILFFFPMKVFAQVDDYDPDIPVSSDYTDGLPLFPADIYGRHYVLVSSHTTDIATVTFYLLIFDDISRVTSDYTADEVSLGSEFLLRGVNGNGVRYWYQYSFEDGWVQSTKVVEDFRLSPRDLRINSVTFDIPLTSDSSVIAIPANTGIIDNHKHIDSFGRLMFGVIDMCDTNYLGIMPLVCMVSSAIIVLVYRMIGRGF